MSRPIFPRSKTKVGVDLFFRFILFILMVMAGSSQAQSLAEAEAALQAGDLVRAEAIAKAAKTETSEEADHRGWIIALAQLRQGRVQEAVPALERLVARHPDVTRLRLELASAYFRLGRDMAARRAFEAARSGGISASEAAAVAGYLERIEARRSSESYLSFSLQPESNAARRTAANVIDIGGLPFVLAPGARARADTGVRLQFGHLALPRLAPDLRARLGVQGDVRFFQDKALNEANLRFEAGLEKLVAPEMPISGGLLFDVRYLGNRPFSTGLGGYLAFATTLGKSQNAGGAGTGRLQARLELVELRHETLPFSNGLRSGLTLGYRHALSSSLVLEGEVSATRLSARAVSESGTTAGVAFGFEKAFNGGLGLAGRVGYAEARRDGPSGLFAVARRDQTLSLDLSLTHRGLDFGGFSPVLAVSAERRASNIALYDYTNYGLSVGLTRRF